MLIKEKVYPIITIDQQMPLLPKEVKFCKNCVVSNQRPRTIFNEEGVCNACEWAYEKEHAIDWEKRERELVELCNKYRSHNGSFDVLVPGSGGKDSGYVAHQLKYRYGMHPLCITWAPFEYTEIGWQNLQSLIHTGFTDIMCQPDQKIHRKLAKLCFELVGDPWQPFTYGQKYWAYWVAQAFNIPLIFYGENGELEYGGSTKYKHMPKEGPEEYNGSYFKGTNVDKVIEIGLERGIFDKDEVNNSPTLQLYKSPPIDAIIKSGVEMHWYSYYNKWTPQENYYYAVEHTGFRTNPVGRSEATYTKYVSLDDKMDGYHYYLGYMKFGLGRCSRDAQSDIRRHHITREEGVALVKRYDHEFPKRHFPWLLKYLDITEEFFWEVCDFYRGLSNVWEKENGKWVLKYVVS